MRDLMFQFSSLKRFPQQRKFAKNPRYIRAETSEGVRAQRHEGKRAFPITC